MQNKGAIIFLAIALALVSIYQLSFTGASYLVKKEAQEFAQGNLVQEAAYLDSIASLSKDEWKFLGNTFKEVQSKEINLGLDLKGGMNVILEVSVEDIVRALSNYSTDANFNQAIALANQRKRESQRNFIELFGESYEEVNPGGSLAAIFGTVELQGAVDEQGNEVTLEATPFIWEIDNKDAFKLVGDIFMKLGKMRRLPVQHRIVFGTEGRSLPNGSTFYLPTAELDMTKALEIDGDTQETLANFLGWVSNYNEYIINAWDENAHKSEKVDTKLVDEFVDVDSEEIPF